MQLRWGARLAAVVTAGAAGLLATSVAMLPAHAACNVMTYQFDPTVGAAVISPASLTVNQGACITFHNATLTSAQFTVGSRYKATAQALGDATPNYIAGPAGTTQKVTGTGAAGTAHASIVVRAAPKPSPTPTHSSSPTPRRTSTPATQQSSAPPPGRPSPPVVTPSASPPPVQPLVSPPAGSTPYLAGQPTPTPSSTSSAPAIVAGPLQPPTGRGTGLPAALAALAVVGTAGALLRVLLAEPVGPVETGRTVGAAS